MFPGAHNTLLAIDHCLATSFDLVYRSSSGQLWRNKNIKDTKNSEVGYLGFIILKIDQMTKSPTSRHFVSIYILEVKFA